MKNVLIYTRRAFAISETFIVNQFNSKNINAILVYAIRENDKLFPINALSSYKVEVYPTKNKLKRIAHKIYRRIKRLNKYSFPPATYARFKQIIQEHKIDVVHCNYGNDAIAFIPLIKKTGIPLIAHFHGYDASDKLFCDREYLNSLQDLFKYASMVIVPSRYLGDRLVEKGLVANKLQIIHYGIDLNFYNRGSKNAGGDCIRLLHVGRIVNKKGVPDLIRTINIVRQKTNISFKLDVVGNGYELALSKDIALKRELNAIVRFHGSQPKDVVRTYLSKADIYILNSRMAEDGDTEGLPNSILEAMASGCAVISTRHAGIPEAIEHGKEGILIEENNNSQLGEAILTLLVDKEQRCSLSDAAYKKVKRMFGMQLMNERLEKIFSEITKM